MTPVMPHADSTDCRIYYTATGPADAPMLLLSNSLGTTHEMWESQLPPLSSSFRVVRYDTRGHGQSPAPAGEYTLEQLGRDALAVLDAAGASRARRSHLCGISLGGMTAMWLALNASDHVDRMILGNTGAHIGARGLWDDRMRLLR